MKTITKIFLVICTVLFMTTVTHAKNYQWQLVQSWDEESLYSEMVNRFVQTTKQLSKGQLTINIISSKKGEKPLNVFDLVQQGQYQIGHSDSSYWREKDSNTTFFSSIPFGMTTPEMYAWFYNGGGIELMTKVYDQYGLLSFPGGNTGHQMGGWFRREIKCLAGLRGIAMHMNSAAADVMKSIGVNVVNIPVQDQYISLASGSLAAVSSVNPAVDVDLGFHNIAPFYYTGWNAPSSEMQFLINADEFSKLPENLQQIVKLSMRLSAYDMYTKFNHQNGVKLAEIRKDFPNVKFRSLPPEIIKALNLSSRSYTQSQAEKGNDLTREIVSSIDAYKRLIRPWTRYSNQAYLNNSGI